MRTKKEPSVSTECSLLDHLNDFQSCKTLLTFMWYCRKYVTMSMTCGGNGQTCLCTEFGWDNLCMLLLESPCSWDGDVELCTRENAVKM